MKQDEQMMLLALALSKEARVISPPNPWVGCVIVKDGKIVGEGHTRPPGDSHAEIVALHQAKGNAAGATVYVTLEPCCHFGRTPPCTNALIEAKVARVVIGLQDPDPHVCGKGVQQLRSAGIEVVTGVSSEAIAESLAPYLHHRKTGQPYCIAKTATSIDGRIAAKDGTSQWISSPEARSVVHKFRAESQAIIVGGGTAFIDKPRLTVRNHEPLPAKPPLRVVLDASGRVPAEGPLFEDGEAPTLIVTTEKCPKHTQDLWRKRNAEVVIVPPGAHGVGVDLHSVLNMLGERGVLQVLVEGGGTLLGSFLEAKLLQRFYVHVGALVIGNEGTPLIRTHAVTTLAQAFRLKLLGVEVLGETACLHYTM